MRSSQPPGLQKIELDGSITKGKDQQQTSHSSERAQGGSNRGVRNRRGCPKMQTGSHNVQWSFTESSERKTAETTLQVRADSSPERGQDQGVRVLEVKQWRGSPSASKVRCQLLFVIAVPNPLAAQCSCLRLRSQRTAWLGSIRFGGISGLVKNGFPIELSKMQTSFNNDRAQSCSDLVGDWVRLAYS